MAEVSVRIVEPGYDKVPAIEVPLMIVDPFVILPQHPVFILPVSPFKFDLAHRRLEDNARETHVPISLPNPRYQWGVTEPIIGSINSSGLFCSSTTEGPTGIEVKEAHNNNNTAESSIHVVYPYRIEVKIRDVTGHEKLEKLHDDALWVGEHEDNDTLFGQSLFDLTELKEDAEDEHILIE